MKLILDESELELLPINNNGKGRVILPEVLGRREGSKNKSDLEKEIISIDSALSGVRQKNLAEIHNVSQAEVSIRSRAIDRTNIEGRKIDSEVLLRINQAKFNIADSATAKLMQTLDIFEPNQLEQKNLPSAAVQLASVVDKMSGERDSGSNINFVVFAPRMRSEDSFDVIEVIE